MVRDKIIRVAAATPKIRVADCAFNAARIIEIIKRADEENVRLVCMPALCLTGSTCGDLFLQKALLDGAMDALCEIGLKTVGCGVIAVVGMPTLRRGEVFSAAAVLCDGQLLGVVTESAAFERGGIKFGVEIGSADCGADDVHVVLNPCAEPEIVGAAARRRAKIAARSAKPSRVYVSANAGYGESTTDTVFSGHNLICRSGEIVAESLPFGDGWAKAKIDFRTAVRKRRETPEATQSDEPFFVENPDEILQIQAHALAKRLEHTGTRAVLGISGGLDSTLALLVALRAYEILGRDKREILAVTLPCFGTSQRTKTNAHGLCDSLGVPLRGIDITEIVSTHLRDISHEARDATYENAQARMRTLVLMSLANQHGGIVVGTGNLSEIALGWATFNGDHMSMYNVNSGVPKTVVRKIVRHICDNSHESNHFLAIALGDILSTPVSPELLPPESGEISQHTEEIIGPYELHDFFIWNTLRHGRTPAQIFALAKDAFAGKFSPDEIQKWQKLFYSRFFSQQFKRNCAPDGPKIFPVSLSPRGYNMPSDAESAAWMK